MEKLVVPVSKKRKKKTYNGPPPPKGKSAAPKKRKITKQQIIIYVISGLMILSLAIGFLASGTRPTPPPPTPLPQDLLATPAPDDGTATQQGFGSGDGATTEFQLYRALGGFAEPVYAPTTVSEVRVAGVAQTVGVDYTLGSLGVIDFTVAPAAGAALDWTGTFDWLCRFEDDSIGLERILMGLWGTGDAVAFSNEINP